MANFSLSGELDIRISKFQRQLAVASSKAESFSKDLSASLNGNDYFAPIKTQAKAITKDMRQIFGGIVFAQGFYRTLDALKQCVSAVWDYTNALNNANVAFSNLFSNAELGEEFVAVLQDYAARSPFDFTDVKDAATQLAAYGIESKNLMFVMEGIGNLASITGDYALTFERVSRAIGQINAKGSLKGEEMRQLAEAGLNVKDVYAKLGTSAETLANDNINAADAINAIIDVMNSRYAGALEAANTTVQGLLANLKDVALMVTSSIIQPLYQGVQKYLGKAVDKLSEFQSIFRETNLRNAILQVFGPEVLAKMENMANTIWRIVTIIRSALYPAIQLFSYFGSACSTAFNLILTYVGPVIMVFNSLLTALLKTEAGANLLRTSMALLVAYFIATKVHAIGMMIVTVVSKAFAVLSFIVKAASASLSLFSVSALRTSGALAICKSAWLQFCTSLNVHPIVLAITIILTLIATIIGLKTALSGMFTGLGDWSQLGTEQFLADVQSGSGDISKFNKRLSDTNTGLEDLQDNLEGSGDSAKKAAEGLLSFDEVFSITENNDTATDTGQLGDIGDIEPIEIPSPEFNWELPEVQDMFGNWWQSVLDWFNKLEWPDLVAPIIGSLVNWSDKIWKPFKNGLDKFVKKARTKLLNSGEKLAGYLSEAVDKTVTKASTKFLESGEKIAGYLTESVDKAIVKGVTDVSVDSATTKLAEKVNSINFKSVGEKIAARFEATFGKENIVNIIKKAATNAVESGIKTVPENAAKALGTLSFAEIGTLLISKLSGTLTGIEFKTIIKGFAEKFKNAFSGANLVAALKEGVVIAGLSMVIEYVLECINDSLPEAFQGTAFDALIDNFASELALGLATMLVTKGGFKKKLKAAGIMILVDHVFESIAESFNGSEDSGTATSAITNIVGSICAIAPKIITKLPKGVGWTGIAAIVGDLVFGGISDWFSSNGDTEASNITTQVGGVITSGLSGAGIGAMIGSVVPGIGTAIGAAIGAVAGIAIDLLATNWDSVCEFCSRIPGRIEEWWGDVCDTAAKGWEGFIEWLTGIPESIGSFFSNIWDAIVGLFTPEKAYADEIDTQGQKTMSNFKSGLNKEYESSNGVSGFFKALPGKIKEFFNSAKDWLVDKGSNILSGLKSGVATGWTNAKTFFTNLPSTVQNFFNNASSWLTEKGRNVMSGLKSGIDNTWSGTQSWFQGVGGNIQGFFSGAGNWLHSAGNNVMNGLSTGINNMWGSINNFFWQIPSTIMNCFSNAGNWLWNAGYNILTGLYNGLVNAWNSVSSFISGIGNWIVRNKGPEEYDKKLLIPAGQWIMESLLTGLENRWDDVKDLVQSVGPEIADELGSTGDDGALADGMASALSATDSVFTPIIGAIKSKFTNLNSWFYTLGESLVESLCSGMESRLVDMLTSIGMPATYLSGLTSFNSSITPTAALATPTVQVVPQQVNETPSTSYDDSSNRPILYVGTLIADKQGIRKLKQELDVIELENNRWK